ncbi:long-chain-fatty-acid--CoA ligase [Baekduia soli]|uniref:Long-chain-fatty-acid--CoA ligase n=1 Tax=Baekduia soli TaxID=496014 RepID=A0A5B8U503_9ACTN|nr:acyl-CoA synthetase [Baekduia soli]QEC48021.1 long-chain-fatty-acid--CoA ligase [Baekduia soli]
MNEMHAARSHALGDLLRRSARRDPERLAIVYGPVRQTFAELDETVNRTANALAARGVAQGDHLALHAHNSYGFVVTTLALARLGAVVVPINFMLGADEVAFILDHAQVTGLVAEDALLPVSAAALQASGRADAVGVRAVIADAPATPPEGWEAVDAWFEHPDATEPTAAVGDDDPIALLYTSGTESRPKGAMLTSRSLITQFVSCIVDGEMSRADVEIHPMPLYHCAQLYCFLMPDLYLGAASVILPRPDAGLILEAIEAERATKLFVPPTVWISLLRHPDFETRDLSSLRKGYYGASAMPVEVLLEMSRRLPDVRLFNFYGQTEMSPMATLLRPEDQVRKAGSAGRPSINVETLVVDDQDRPVAPGEVGEIVHRSPHAMLGYYNDPAKTAEAFKNGWFHSGDLGVIDEEGYLSVVDRKKDMIKTGGENVASREVEEVIYAHEAVQEVAIFGLPDPRWIEAVTAAVVPRTGADVTAEEIVAFCRERLAGFKVPKRVEIVGELPKNASGKILKRELRDRFAETV